MRKLVSLALAAALGLGGAALLDSPASAAKNKQKAKASTKSKRTIKQKNKQSNKNKTNQTAGNATGNYAKGGSNINATVQLNQASNNAGCSLPVLLPGADSVNGTNGGYGSCGSQNGGDTAVANNGSL